MNPPILKTLRAAKGYADFTGHKPTRLVKRHLDDNTQVGYRAGPVVGIAYEATRDGETEQYFHRFKKAARPDLIVRDDGRQLFLDGGGYTFTERGIEDKVTMPGLYIVNPSPRRKKRRSKAKKGTAAMAFKRNPARRKRRTSAGRRRRASTTVFVRNPIRRRRRRSVAVAGRRYRRNPSARRMGGKGALKIGPLILPAVSVGLGAVGAEMLMGYLPLPAMLKTGQIRHVTKAGVGVAAGWLLSKYMSRRVGEAFALGSIAIAVHDAAKEAITGLLPGARFGEYMPTGMGLSRNWDGYGYPQIENGDYTNIGYYSPGTTFETSPNMGEYMGEAGETSYRS